MALPSNLCSLALRPARQTAAVAAKERVAQTPCFSLRLHQMQSQVCLCTVPQLQHQVHLLQLHSPRLLNKDCSPCDGLVQQPVQSRAAPIEADGVRICTVEVGSHCVIQSSGAPFAVSIGSAHSSTVTASSAPILAAVSSCTLHGEFQALWDAAQLHLVGGWLDSARLMFLQAPQARKRPSLQQLTSTADTTWREDNLVVVHASLALIS